MDEVVVLPELVGVRVPSFPLFACLTALNWELGRVGGGEGDGRRRLGTLRVRVVVRRTGVWSAEWSGPCSEALEPVAEAAAAADSVLARVEAMSTKMMQAERTRKSRKREKRILHYR